MLWLLLFYIKISCLCILKALCESVMWLYSYDVFIVDLPTIVPFYFTWSIWTGPGIDMIQYDCRALHCNVILRVRVQSLRAAAYLVDPSSPTFRSENDRAKQ